LPSSGKKSTNAPKPAEKRKKTTQKGEKEAKEPKPKKARRAKPTFAPDERNDPYPENKYDSPKLALLIT
jgi:hypothetical protein